MQRQHREKKSDAETARVPKENLRLRVIVPEKPEQRAHESDDRKKNREVSENRRRGDDCRAGNDRDSTGEPIEPVYEVEDVRHAHYPENNQRHTNPSEGHADAIAERDCIDVSAECDRNESRDDLRYELHAW